MAANAFHAGDYTLPAWTQMKRLADAVYKKLHKSHIEACGNTLERPKRRIALTGFDAVKRDAIELEHESKLPLRHAFTGTTLRNRQPEALPEIRIM